MPPMPISPRSTGGPTNSHRCRRALLACALSPWLFAQTYTTWRDYSGSPDAAQYSALKQIDRSNVAQLKLAWTYPTGDDQHYLFNPIVIGETMYVLAKNNSIVALDAATGSEIWTHTPSPEVKIITNRGINYWESRDGYGPAASFLRGSLPSRHRCPYRQANSVLRRQRRRELERRSRPRSANPHAGAVHNAGPGL